MTPEAEDVLTLDPRPDLDSPFVRAPAEDQPDESHALYRFLAENTGDVIVRSDLAGRSLYVSPAASDLYGCAPADLVGTHILDSVHPDDAIGLRSRITTLARGTVDRITASYRARRHDGTWAWVETNFRLVRAASGKPREIVGITRDISER